MANYVYNDSFSSISTEKEKKPEKRFKRELSKKAIIAIVASAIFVLMCLNLLMGILIGNEVAKNSPYNVVHSNSTIYTAPPSEKLADADQLGVADIVANVSGSVVEIKTEHLSTTSSPEAVKSGAGSGVIFGTYYENDSRVGYNIITSLHVIQNKNATEIAKSITITTVDGDVYTGDAVEVRGYDADSGLAVLRIKEAKKSLTCATFATPNSVRAGDSVVAIGNPLSGSGYSVTSGIISATEKKIKVDSYTTMLLMQANITVNPGNSGGGLFDMNGRLVGIINTKISASNVDGIAFASSVDSATKIATDLAEHQYVQQKPFIGVEFKKHLDGYVRVESLRDGYNDELLVVGDKVLSVNGNKVYDENQVYEFVKDCKRGDTIMLVIMRGDVELSVPVTVLYYLP